MGRGVRTARPGRGVAGAIRSAAAGPSQPAAAGTADAEAVSDVEDGPGVAPAATSGEVRSKAFRLLARRERSRAELQALLDPRGNEREVVTALLDELQQQGWLSDARLAEQMVSARRSRAGAARIRLELRRRGLDAEAVSAATEGLEAGDLATATALWRRRFGSPPADRAERDRQFRFLVARGFSRSVAAKVLRAAGDAATDEHMENDDD